MRHTHFDKIYEVEVYGKRLGRAYTDLLVTDDFNNVYLIDLIGTDAHIDRIVESLQEMRSASIRYTEKSSDKDRTFQIYPFSKNVFDVYTHKMDELTHALVIAKNARLETKGRQEWMKEEEKRLQEGKTPRKVPMEYADLILAWNGDLESQVYKILWERYNTPMLEDWKDYIISQLMKNSYFIELNVMTFGKEYSLRAGLLRLTEKQLEDIIREGILSYELDFAIMNDGRTEDESVLLKCKSLDEYLSHFAEDLGRKIQENCEIRFDPTKEKHHEAFYDLNLHANKNGLTGLFPPQADVVQAVGKTLQEEDYAFVIGEMGVGKTAVGASIPYITEAIRQKTRHIKPYRALVFSPTIMVEKWKREIQERIPNAKVYEIKSWKDCLKLLDKPYRPTEIEYYVMGSDVGKNSYPLVPVEDWRHDLETAKELKAEGKRPRVRPTKIVRYVNGREVIHVDVHPTGYHCPQCAQPLKTSVKRNGNDVAGPNFFKNPRTGNYVKKAENMVCTNTVETKYLPKHLVKDKHAEKQICGYKLWGPARLNLDSGHRKVSPAWFINKKLRRGFFKYLIADEVHEYKSGDSNRATAFGQLVNHTEKQILLTGTLLGGHASDIFYLLARLAPEKLKRESITFNDLQVFIERYGVYEYKFKNSDRTNEMVKRGSQEKAGVSPHVFSRYLVSNCAFLELADLGYALPPYREEPIFVVKDPEHKRAYDELARKIGSAMRSYASGMKYVSQYVNTLYQYSDMPFNFGDITYYDEKSGKERSLVKPRNFDIHSFTPTKYHRLTQLIDEQVYQRNRKVLIYCRFTGNERSVDTYLYDKLKAEGYNVGILRSSGSYDGIKMPKQQDREIWLKEMMEKHDWDILITNPKLVSVGLDLLDFPTIVYYQMDYSAYNYMQSSRRSWRIRQTQPVEVYMLVYEGTIQAEVLDVIAKKMDAAMALQGKFSEEGLRAMVDAGDGLNAIAKKLMSEGKLDNVQSIENRWKRINHSYEEMQNATFEGYDDYEMNPLGIEEVRRIQQGIADRMRKDVEAGKISTHDLNAYLERVELFITEINAAEYNRGRKKKERVIDGQLAFDLFAN